jgi:hypothetical protein
MKDSDLNPLTSSDVTVVTVGRISIALTKRNALTPGGKLVALMFAHQDSGKLDAYVYDEDGEHHIEV